MNFLAHLYLSGNDKKLMIGNFIADHLKANKFKHYDQKIQDGIILHRKIDSFTDKHKIVKQSKRRLHERYGLYRGIIIDIFYDHFLAKNWQNYSEIPLGVYSKSVYLLLEDNFNILPKKTQQILPYMQQYDWLYNYQFLNGMQDVLNGMNRRTKGKSQMHLAIDDLKQLENELDDDFNTFFEELRTFSEAALSTIRRYSN